MTTLQSVWARPTRRSHAHFFVMPKNAHPFGVDARVSLCCAHVIKPDHRPDWIFTDVAVQSALRTCINCSRRYYAPEPSEGT